MFDRHTLGDLALAVLLVLPLTGLASFRPDNHAPAAKTAAHSVAGVHAPGGRISLLG